MALSPLHTFNNKYLDDLAFILLSPELFCTTHQTFNIDSIEIRQWLKKEELNQNRINTHFENYSIKKLGWYAEQLMQYFFSNYPSFKLLGQNIQLFDGKITTGEIDFLIKDNSTNEIIQVELATKFYIKYGDRYIGPNAKDNLEKKHNRLINHQLQKTTPDEVLKLTEGASMSSAKLIVKGIIFYPYSEFIADNYSFPDYINSNHNKGWHLSFDNLLTQEIDHLYYLPKTEWLGTNSTQRIEKCEFKSFFTELFEYNRAIMVLDKNQQRGFITSADWPN